MYESAVVNKVVQLLITIHSMA